MCNYCAALGSALVAIGPLSAWRPSPPLSPTCPTSIEAVFFRLLAGVYLHTTPSTAGVTAAMPKSWPLPQHCGGRVGARLQAVHRSS